MTSPAVGPTTSSNGPSNPGGSSSSGAPQPPWVTAWLSALQAEHEAIFGYDTLGPLLTSAQRASARANELAHRALRDSTAAAMTAEAIDPPAARADYPLPDPLRTPAEAEAYAQLVEERCAASWRYLVATCAEPGSGAAPTLRAGAVTALRDSAVRATGWRARRTPDTPTVPFPGLS
jgi:hypothetical protein